jgi:peroxiredoxin Q/BCP
MPRFDGVDAVVLGVSPDSVESHAKFRKNFDLTFPLLADTEHDVAEAYGVWGKRKTLSVSYEGVERSTFPIDENGIVENVWREVNAAGHMEMLAELLGA